MHEKIWNVVPLRKKVLIYFSAVIILIGVISAILYYNMTKTFNQFNDVYGNLKILDDYSSSIDKINSELNKYLSESDRSYISVFYQEYGKLQNDINNTQLHFINKDDNILFENIKNMVSTYGDEADAAINEYRKRDVNETSNNLSHALKIQSYIKDNINELILSYISESKIFQKNLLDQLLILRLFIIILIIMSVALFILLAAYFNRALIRPIDLLVAMANKISRGDFEVEKAKVSSFSELKMLSDTLFSMSCAIMNYINEIKGKAEVEKLLHAKELENLKINALLQETELKRLQAQVNPHFLFNTLTTLHHTAFLEGATETCEIAESISKILRYNLRKSNTIVLLKDEIENIKHYIYIQEKRYKHRVTVTFNIDDTLLKLPIPNMTVQPIVENSFIHGVEQNESKGEIEISVYSQRECVIVEVKDNGAGMDEDEMNRVINLISDSRNFGGHTSSIGINNVVKRLQAFYKKDDIINIQSSQGAGTIISLLLPNEFEYNFDYNEDTGLGVEGNA